MPPAYAPATRRSPRHGMLWARDETARRVRGSLREYRSQTQTRTAPEQEMCPLP